MGTPLSDDDLKDWRKALGLDEDDDAATEETPLLLLNAVGYYTNVVETARALVKETENMGPKALAETVERALRLLVLPHVEDATVGLETALQELRSALEESAEDASAESRPPDVPEEGVPEEGVPKEEEEEGVPEEDESALNDDLSAQNVELVQSMMARVEAAEQNALAEKLRRQAAEQRAQDAEQNALAEKLRRQAAEQNALAEKLSRQAAEQRALAENLSRQLGSVEGLASRCLNKTEKVNSLFVQMAKLSQAEVQIHDTLVIREESQIQMKLQKESRILYPDDSDVLARPSPDDISKLVEDACVVPIESSFHRSALLALFGSLDDKARRGLTRISEAYNDFIMNSNILDRPDTTNTTSGINKKRSASPHPTAQKVRRVDGGRQDIVQKSEAGTRTPEAEPVPLQDYEEMISSSTKELTDMLNRVLDDKPASAAVVPTYFPGPRSQEVHGAQPFFACVLSIIAHFCEKLHVQHLCEQSEDGEHDPRSREGGQAADTKEASLSRARDDDQQDERMAESPSRESSTSEQSESRKMSTPPKVRVGKESLVLDHGLRFRRGDFSIAKDGRHVWLYRADTIPLIIEIKALYRGNENWSDLISSAVQQVLNHVSRYVRVGFDFAGAGTPSHATGVVGSLAYVQVYRLELLAPGTERAKLQIVKSELLPLMTRKVFKQWSRAHPRRREGDRTSGAEEALFMEENSNELPIPLGFLVLFQLVLSSKSDTFGQSLSHGSLGAPIPQLLACGTFGNVFSCGESGIVKMSRHGRTSYLKAELCAYKAVGQVRLNLSQDTTDSLLCRYMAASAPEIKERLGLIGSLRVMIPCLDIIPKGKPLLHFGDISGRVTFLCKMVFDVALALQHMHSRGVAHNDVSLSNVVVVRDDEDGTERAVLVDLSLACPFSFEIPLFRGNPVYAHRDIHRMKRWSPRPFHDMAALGFLAAVLVSGSVAPWRTFDSIGQSDDAYNDRSKVASGAVDKLETLLSDEKHYGLSQDLARIKEWIACDRDKSISRTYCSCRTKKCHSCGCRTKKLRCCPYNCRCKAECGNSRNSFPLFPASSTADIYYERPSAMVDSRH